MKKRFEIFKALQLCAYIAIAVITLICIVTDSELYQLVGRNTHIRIPFILLWITLGISLYGILRDLSEHRALKKDYHELDHAVYNDQLAGIANRFSCDAMIEKYADTDLPENMCCMMLEMSGLREINRKEGHAGGNRAIRVFSEVLATASVGLCFVGRNGGNKYLAIFENADTEKTGQFLKNIDRLMPQRVKDEHLPVITYKTGIAYAGELQGGSITRIIAMADRRLAMQTDSVSGIAGRNSCDEIISRYEGIPLPADMAAAVLNMTNLPQINAERGRTYGDAALRAFAEALLHAANGNCFIGRNGGMGFMAIFEENGSAGMQCFLDALHNSLRNKDAEYIQYNVGTALNAGEHVQDIHELIRIAAERAVDCA